MDGPVSLASTRPLAKLPLLEPKRLRHSCDTDFSANSKGLSSTASKGLSNTVSNTYHTIDAVCSGHPLHSLHPSSKLRQKYRPSRTHLKKIFMSMLHPPKALAASKPSPSESDLADSASALTASSISSLFAKPNNSSLLAGGSASDAFSDSSASSSRCLHLSKNLSEKSLKSFLSVSSWHDSSLTSASNSDCFLAYNRESIHDDLKKVHFAWQSSDSATNPAITSLFYSVSNNKPGISYESFKGFYMAQNNGPIDENQISQIFSTFSSTHNGSMALAEFASFLASQEYNGPFTQQKQDYSHPLNEYFISSSHNTYLTGRQVGGQSSIDAYIYTLKKGCRCVEIDIWNGDNGPVVSHGLTLTSSVSLRKVAQVVKKYAFVASDLPLILSIEIHCKKAYQTIVKDILSTELGDSLLTQSLNHNIDESQLPSVDQLRNKILIKIKRSGSSVAQETVAAAASATVPVIHTSGSDNKRSSKEYLLCSIVSNATTASLNAQSVFVSPTFANGNPSSLPASSASYSSSSSSSDFSSSSFTHSSSGTETDLELEAIDRQTRFRNKRRQLRKAKLVKTSSKKRSSSSSSFKIIPELCAMSFYVYGIKFKSFDLDESKTFNHCFSFSNRRLLSMVKNSSEHVDSIHRHNLNHLMRIYPAGYKITSRNFDPISFWKLGCQLVATNWQTFDLGEQINESMFSVGDKSGYVLKPEYLRSPNNPITNNRCLKNHNIDSKFLKNIKFSFEIISAELGDQNLDLSYPSVSMQVLGVENALHDVEKLSVVNNKFPYSLSSSFHSSSELSAPRNTVCYDDEELVFKTCACQYDKANAKTPVWKTKFSGVIKDSLKDFIFLRFTVSNDNILNNTSHYYSNYFGSSDNINSLSSSQASLSLVNKASITVRLIHLQKGYRFLPLYGSRGNELSKSKLFVKINYEEV